MLSWPENIANLYNILNEINDAYHISLHELWENGGETRHIAIQGLHNTFENFRNVFNPLVNTLYALEDNVKYKIDKLEGEIHDWTTQQLDILFNDIVVYINDIETDLRVSILELELRIDNEIDNLADNLNAEINEIWEWIDDDFTTWQEYIEEEIDYIKNDIDVREVNLLQYIEDSFAIFEEQFNTDINLQIEETIRLINTIAGELQTQLEELEDMSTGLFEAAIDRIGDFYDMLDKKYDIITKDLQTQITENYNDLDFFIRSEIASVVAMIHDPEELLSWVFDIGKDTWNIIDDALKKIFVETLRIT